MVTSFQDGSSLPIERLYNSRMEIRTSVEMKGGGRRDLPTRDLKMSEIDGVWQITLDMKEELGLTGRNVFEELNNIGIIKLLQSSHFV